jgi:hypothetical protein
VVTGGCIGDQPHEWGHLENPAGSAYRYGPLACLSCGVVWPGEQLPDPYRERNPGYGDLEGFVPWGERVDAMVDELGRAA